jgi:hypothetical protein
MGRIRLRPSGTALAQSACTTRAWPTALPGWPHAAAHDPMARRPSGGCALVQRAHATASLHRLHGGAGPWCSSGYACLTVLRSGSVTAAWWRLRVVARAHARSWPNACAAAVAAAGHGDASCGSGDKAAQSTMSSTLGGDAAAVPVNGAEGDGGSR